MVSAAVVAVVQALIAYQFGKELKDSGSGLVAAALMAVVPGRSREVTHSPPHPGGGE